MLTVLTNNNKNNRSKTQGWKACHQPCGNDILVIVHIRKMQTLLD